jgi:hypothetical protein
MAVGYDLDDAAMTPARDGALPRSTDDEERR